MTIYLITDMTNYKQYVGLTTGPTEKRIRQHLNSAKSGTVFLSDAISEHGVENFMYSIIDSANNRKDLKEKEKFWIRELRTQFPNGYNSHPGGCGGINSAIVLRMRPIVCLSNGQTFKSITEAAEILGLSRVNISAVCRGRTNSTGGLVFEYLEEKIRSVSSIVKTTRVDAAAKNLNAAALRLNARKRLKIRCVDTNTEYESMTQAAKDLRIRLQSIYLVCNGKQDTAGNLKFEFVDNDRKSVSAKKTKTRKIIAESNKLSNLIKAQDSNRKKIKCVSSGKIYNSIEDAAKELGVTAGAISRVLRKINKTVKGLTFIYLGDKDGEQMA
jgi:hypothetical protein